MDSTDVIPGPAIFLISVTTIGHTNAGGRIITTHESDEVTTHESDPAPVDVKQRPARHRMEIDLCEINVANLGLLCGDITTTNTNVIRWKGELARTAAPTIATAELRNTRPNGSVTIARIHNAKALVPEFTFSGMRGEKAIMNVVLQALYYDSGTLAELSGVGA